VYIARGDAPLSGALVVYFFINLFMASGHKKCKLYFIYFKGLHGYYCA
jgi:hypothetical protein